MDALVGGDCGIDGVEEADELLMPVAGHIAADDGAIEDIEYGEQCRGAVTLVIMGHRAEPSLFERQARLCAIERLYLALFVERQHDGVGWMIDIQPDNIVELVSELWIVGELELLVVMGLQPVFLPDGAHRTGADPRRFGHHVRRPVRGLPGGVGQRQSNHLLDHFASDRRYPRRPGLVTQQAIDAFGHKPFLPAPHTSLRLARPPHDRSPANPVSRKQNNRRAPDMLLRRVTIRNHPIKAAMVRRRKVDGYSGAHNPDSHDRDPKGIPKRTHALCAIH